MTAPKTSVGLLLCSINVTMGYKDFTWQSTSWIFSKLPFKKAAYSDSAIHITVVEMVSDGNTTTGNSTLIYLLYHGDWMITPVLSGSIIMTFSVVSMYFWLHHKKVIRSFLLGKNGTQDKTLLICTNNTNDIKSHG